MGCNLFSYTDSQKDIFLGDLFSDQNSNIKDYKYDLESHYLPGAFIKMRKNKNLVRFSFDYTKNKYLEHHYYGDWTTSLKGDIELFEYRLGYERDFGNKKIRPFISTDLTLRYSKFSGMYHYFYTQTSSFLVYDIKKVRLTQLVLDPV